MRTPLFPTSPIRPNLLPPSPTRTMASGTGGTPSPPFTSSSSRRQSLLGMALAAADTASLYCALLLLALILLSSLREGGAGYQGGLSSFDNSRYNHLVAGGRFPKGAEMKPCDEIYVVGGGETLHTISDKCKDPFIVERNPHIHDPDDVFPGLVIMIVPPKPEQ